MILFLASCGKREIILFSLLWIFLGGLLGWLFPPAAAVPACGLLFTLYFFRDPRRKIPEDPQTLVSPADGTVVEISEVPSHDVLGEDSVKIAVFKLFCLSPIFEPNPKKTFKDLSFQFHSVLRID